MKKHGILHKSDLAQAAHDGEKDVTRRLMTPQPPEGVTGVTETVVDGKICWCFERKTADGKWKFWHARPRLQRYMVPAIRETHWRCGSYHKSNNGYWCFTPYTAPIGGPNVIFKPPEFAPRTKTIVGYHKRPGLFLPYDNARTYVEILSVRPEMLHAITGADARREGVTFDAVRAILAPYAAKADVRPHHWIHGHPEGEAESYCDQCIDAGVAEAIKEYPKEHAEFEIFADGGYDSMESEGVRCCETCGALVEYTLLEYGVEYELGRFEDYSFDYKDPREAHELTCIFDEADYVRNAELKDRAYRLAFAVLWDSINAAKGHPWANNDWVWRYEYRRVKGAAK